MFVRTTMQPSTALNVTDHELGNLTALGIVYKDWRDLYGSFLCYSDGPPAEVTGVTIRIRNASNADVVATTSTGVIKLNTGSYLYRWSQTNPTPPAGAYTVTWTGVDADSITTTATETVTVPA